MQEYGDVVRIRVGPIYLYQLTHPDHIRYVLHENSKHFTKRSRSFDKLRPVLGEGLLTSEGEFWLRQRRLMQPLFDRRTLPHFADAMTQATLEMAQRWEQSARAKQAVDVAEQMMELTLSIVGRTILGTDVGSEAKGVSESMAFIQNAINERIFALFDFVEKLPLKRNREFNDAVGLLDSIVYKVIGQRRRDPQASGDLVSLLIRTRHADSGESMSDQQLRDEVMTFLLAGHETTANNLAWTWLLLAENQAHEHRLHAELQQILDGRPPQATDLEELDLTQRILMESMRLYPPAWILERTTLRPETFSDFHIPAGSLLSLSPYLVHRHPQFWSDPEQFDPDRFLPGAIKARHHWAYFPFGGGPRTCIGNHFAMMETTLAVATLAQRFRLKLPHDHVTQMEPLVTLRPLNGLKMFVEKR